MSAREDAAHAASIDAWEAAYVRFETPSEEIAKFTRRLVRLGARDWPRDAAIVELCCGRGNGLVALERLGFRRVVGVDLSARLLARHTGGAGKVRADCRALPVRDGTQDFVIVQGGLHHLAVLDLDLARTLEECRRVLRANGRLVVVEPWSTPFLRCVHAVAGSPAMRALSPKIRAFAAMVEEERATYERWLASPDSILEEIDRGFAADRRDIGWGKLEFVGIRRDAPRARPARS